VEFDAYVEARRGALMRFATVLTGQTWLADDLVSDVLGRAYEAWPRIDALDDPHAYIRRMIVNDHLSFRRRWARTSPVADIDPGPDIADSRIDDVAERDAMVTRLELLPRKQRTAVVLRYYVGLSDAAIADHLGCREVTVRTQISRALRTLRIGSVRPLTPLHQETP
jgi:RNA polymerase sigma-70 factor (sigma-E family)